MEKTGSRNTAGNLVVCGLFIALAMDITGCAGPGYFANPNKPGEAWGISSEELLTRLFPGERDPRLKPLSGEPQPAGPALSKQLEENFYDRMARDNRRAAEERAYKTRGLWKEHNAYAAVAAAKNRHCFFIDNAKKTGVWGAEGIEVQITGQDIGTAAGLSPKCGARYWSKTVSGDNYRHIKLEITYPNGLVYGMTARVPDWTPNSVPYGAIDIKAEAIPSAESVTVEGVGTRKIEPGSALCDSLLIIAGVAEAVKEGDLINPLSAPQAATKLPGQKAGAVSCDRR